MLNSLRLAENEPSEVSLKSKNRGEVAFPNGSTGGYLATIVEINRALDDHEDSTGLCSNASILLLAIFDLREGSALFPVLS